MGLGLLTGREKPGGPVDENYQRVQQLVQQFEEKFGSLNCQDLTGVHLGTEEGQAAFREKGQIENCLNYVEAVTRIVISLVSDKP